MTQQDLFDKSVTGLDGNSHHGDPISSFEAGEDAVKTGLVSDHHSIILAAKDFTPATNMEIVERTGLTQAQVARRMKELERRGKVERGPFMICPMLNRKVGTWALTY